MNLIEIFEDENVKLDLRYASKNNFCGIKLYDEARCFLHKDGYSLFLNAIEIAKKQKLKFKIFDAFRPISVQKIMYEKFPEGGFISNPHSGSTPHCRGVAIDLTLLDEFDKELEMGTDFDDFSELAFHNCKKISKKATKNRKILFDIMKDAGFDFYSKEWWHYQLFQPRKYDIIS